ncbi:CLUMA_CG010121, isoform A [Clunio marinus]|uniref:CLUMA_CG010121, isoform A n=1 Tax=Clunio marinus TaxID=568069 RepID=A0A1J1I8Q9_9DIPT|nr:CLUMA_CG010121, isoform A [Clunio marinus]
MRMKITVHNKSMEIGQFSINHSLVGHHAINLHTLTTAPLHENDRSHMYAMVPYGLQHHKVQHKFEIAEQSQQNILCNLDQI